LVAGFIALAVIVTAGTIGYRQGAYPKRFGVVVDGHLYRSGEVSPIQLARLNKERGVRRVLSLLDPEAPQSVAERAAAERLGIEWINVPLRGNGESTPADRERIKQVLSASNEIPTLVHCAAGSNRTGLAVGLYRIHEQGWTVARVLAEMRDYDFEDEAHHQNLRDALTAEAGERTSATAPAPP